MYIGEIVAELKAGIRCFGIRCAALNDVVMCVSNDDDVVVVFS